ncbi:hypothetical protein ACVV62_01455 [Streptococcus pluranimalium]
MDKPIIYIMSDIHFDVKRIPPHIKERFQKISSSKMTEDKFYEAVRKLQLSVQYFKEDIRFISEMPKDFDPIFDLTDIYQILNSNDK